MPSNKKPTILAITVVVLALLVGTIVPVVVIYHVAPEAPADVTIVSSHDDTSTDVSSPEDDSQGEHPTLQRAAHSIRSLTTLNGPWACLLYTSDAADE